MNDSRSHIDHVNARVYHAVGVDTKYRSRVLLTRVETVALLKYHAAFAGKDILDVGVGTGRTTAYLAPLSGSYQAIDYSPVMVRAMHDAMPDIAVHLCDMRDMRRFAEASFDFVFAPDNILDAVNHDGRMAALQECRRVLRAGGTLMLSAHNLDWRHAGHAPRLFWSHNPVTQLRHTHIWLRRWRNYRSLKPMRSRETSRETSQQIGHAILNDSGHDFALLHYYIGQVQQRKQLHAVGFDVLDVMDATGASLAPDALTADVPHLMYTAIRRATL